jgi:hypothetical protein
MDDNFNSSPNIRVIKSRSVKWACMEKMRNAYGTLVGKPEGKRRL